MSLPHSVQSAEPRAGAWPRLALDSLRQYMPV